MAHYKTVVKTIAAQNGFYASFMPKPFKDCSGSGLKITLCIKKDDKSIFGTSHKDLTPEGRAFIGSVIVPHRPGSTGQKRTGFRWYSCCMRRAETAPLSSAPLMRTATLTSHFRCC